MCSIRFVLFFRRIRFMFQCGLVHPAFPKLSRISFALVLDPILFFPLPLCRLHSLRLCIVRMTGPIPVILKIAQRSPDGGDQLEKGGETQENALITC